MLTIEANRAVPTDEVIEARDYVAVLGRQRVFVAAMAALGLALGATYVALSQAMYASTAKVLVRPTASVTPERPLPLEQQLSMETEREIAGSTAVARLAARDIGTGEPPERLLQRLSVGNPPETQILEFAFLAAEPERARDGAQAFADAYLRFKREQAESEASALREAVQQQLTDLEAQVQLVETDLNNLSPGSAEARELRSVRDVLVGQIAVLRGRSVAIPPAADPGEVIAPASLPGGRASPKPVRDLGLGLFLGLFVGVVIAFARDRLDDRIRGAVDAEEAAGVPVLATIPHRGKRGRRAPLSVAQDPDSPNAERYRALGATLLRSFEGRRLRSLMVVGPLVREPAAITAANLSIVLAQSGKRVITVGTDLQGSRLHGLFGLENEVGLADVFGDLTLLPRAAQPSEIDRLKVVTSGSASARASNGVLGLDAIRTVLNQLLLAVDVAVLETRPVLNAADAVTLAPLTDGVLIVAEARSTRRGALTRMRQELDVSGANVVGMVVHNVRPPKDQR